MAKRKAGPQLREFGKVVAQARKEAGIGNQTILAGMVNVTRSYIGQVESGYTRCRREFAVALDEALTTGTAITEAWDELLKSASYPEWFIDFSMAESTARMVRAYASYLIYGLFQSEGYVRALLSRESDIEGRLRRQALITRNPPVEMFVVMDESTLLRPVARPEVMRAQCEHLLSLTELDHVALQIVPANTYCPSAHAAFAIATQEDGGEVANQTGVIRGEVMSARSDVVHLASTFAALQAVALSSAESRHLIERTMAERWNT